ncbi:MAG: glycosyltransferase family 2 protein [Alphaproteobacteria bacterium]|nr:glycosyltransferase family 2 protein [Alphaproteobacteria bacterium]
MNYPLISCKMITYGRVDTLEESLHSFLQQDYPGPKELIIVNDYPLQTLIFDHPEVKIINLNYTFSTIGEKENFATELCNGDIICQWDDDDVALPNHLSNVFEQFTDDVNILHWETGVLCHITGIEKVCWIGNSGIVFRKSAWEAVGKHPKENAGYDMTFIEKLHDYGGRKFVKMPDDKASWFYMWGGRGYHMSGEGHDKPGKPNAIQRHSLHVENLRIQGKVPTGDVILKPHWNKNYKQMLIDFLAHQQ